MNPCIWAPALAAACGLIALAACSVFAPQNPVAGGGKGTHGPLLGAYLGNEPPADFERKLGRKLDIVAHYYGWNWTAPDLAAGVDKDVAGGRGAMLTWEAATGTVNGQYTCAAMTDIVAGKYDSQLRAQAATTKTIPATIYVRLFPEFSNHPAGHNCANPTRSPTLYIGAFDHVVSVFHSTGVINVKWVYAPYGGSWEDGTAAKSYPGSQYVDIIAEDEYNMGVTPENFPADICVSKDAASLGKPEIVTETGAIGEALQAQWLGSVRAVCPNLYALLYFDADGKNSNGSYVISDPASFAALRALAQ